jgi:PTH1 family peptidyl-tRNA hydrolase
MKIIAGLGNPTVRYEETLHNLGFMVVDAFACAVGFSEKWKKECDGLTAHIKLRDVTDCPEFSAVFSEGSTNAGKTGLRAVNSTGEKINPTGERINSAGLRAVNLDEKVILLKPQTYMNLSGWSVQALMSKYKVSNKDLIVVFDDIDLPLGALRLREKGSAGTHNGMRNIIDLLGTTDFPRIRVGAGRPPSNIPLKDYVLMRITTAQTEELALPIENAKKILARWTGGEGVSGLTKFNIDK